MGRVGDNPSMCCLSSSRLPGPGLLRDLSLFRSAFSSPGHDTSRVRGSAGAMPRDKDAVWNYFSKYTVDGDRRRQGGEEDTGSGEVQQHRSPPDQ